MRMIKEVFDDNNIKHIEDYFIPYWKNVKVCEKCHGEGWTKERLCRDCNSEGLIELD